MSLYLLVAAYGTVLLSELLGDKSLVTIGMLATRFRSAPLFAGITLGFMAKMLVAVLLGRAIGELPPALVARMTAVSFVIGAFVIWFKRSSIDHPEPKSSRSAAGVALVSFAVIFLSEWADAGQIAAASLSARYQAPLLVWIGASMALITKGTVALTLGAKLKWLISFNTLRRVGVCLFVAMGILAALGIRL